MVEFLFKYFNELTDIPKEARKEILKIAKPKYMQTNTKILNMVDKKVNMYIVVEGAVNIYYSDKLYNKFLESVRTTLLADPLFVAG